MGRDWKKRMGCILLAVILTVSNVQPVFATTVEDDDTGLCDHHMVHENCGYVEGEENSCTYSCALCIAEEKATADQAAADAVSVQIAALPTVNAVKEMTQEAQLSAHEQTQAAYTAYNALTEEQKSLLPTAEEVFKPLFDYFNSLTAAAMDVTDSFAIAGSCGDLTWELDEGGTLTISGEGKIPDYFVQEGQNPPWYEYRTSVKEINIGQTVTGIGDDAFAGCENMTTITIPDGVSKIGSRAFDSCSNLSSITIPESVTGIGDHAFFGCSLLQAVVVPDSVEELGVWVFSGCSSLECVDLPDNLGSIPSGTFNECSGLQEITIPSTISFIYDSAFNGCSRLREITLPQTATLEYRCFYGCSSLTSIEIPQSVIEIGAQAFAGCTGLTEIKFEGDAPVFGENEGIKLQFESVTATIYYPDENETWTEDVRQNYGGTVTWTKNNSSESGTDEPGGTLLGGTCGDLNWELEDGVLTIAGNGAMPDYSWTEAPWYDHAIDILSVVISDGVTTIGNSAFYRCRFISEVVIADSVTRVGDSAFWECKSLKAISLPDSIITLEDRAFTACSGLESITLSDRITSLGEDVFARCEKLISITIPENVTKLESGAFSGCSDLEEIRFLGSAPEIATDSFDGVTATAYYPEGNETWTEEVRQNYGGTITWVAYDPNGSQSNYIFYPENGATEVGTVSASGEKVAIDRLTITFDKKIRRYSITSSVDARASLNFDAGTISIYRKADDELIWQAEENPFLSGTSGDTITVDYAQTTLVIEPSDRHKLLEYDTEYYIVVDPGFINYEDGSTNDAVSKGCWEFKTLLDNSNPPLKLSNHEFFYWSNFSKQMETYTFDYDESWFMQDSDVYNYDLVRMSMRMAMATASTCSDEISDLFNTMGFESTVALPEPTTHSIGYAIGSKNIVDEDGSKFTLIAISIRGNGYGDEWDGNFCIGSEGAHKGFSIAALNVLSALETYLEENKATNCSVIKVWISGYSRAAATANLLASKLNNGAIKRITKDNVYAFCFACPQNTIDIEANSKKYDNIINIVNPIDFVPKVAMTDWGFTRYGITYYLPSAAYNGKYYKELEPQMKAKYTDILSGVFGNVSSEYVEDHIPQKTKQVSELVELSHDLAYFFVSREHYVEKYETRAMEVLGDLFNGGEDTEGLKDLLFEAGGIGAILCFIDYKQSGDLANAHFSELYLAWLDALKGDLETDPKYRKIFVNCPVDIMVYNSKDELVGKISDGEPIDIEKGIGTYLDADGQNVIILPRDEEYSINLIATDNGNVTYTATEYNLDSGTTSKVVSYYEIEVNMGDNLIGTVENLEEVSDAQYPLSLNGEDCESDIVQTGNAVSKYTVTVQKSGNGTVSQGNVYHSGEFAKVSAVPSDGASFAGWFVNDELVSTELEYRFLVTSDVSITGRFGDDTTGGDSSDDTPTDEAADIDDILAQLSGMTAQNVVPGDKTKILSILGTIEVLLAEEELTDEQRQLLTTAKEKGEMLLDAIAALETAAKNVSDRITGLPTTVEPDDEDAVAQIMAAKKAYDELDTRAKALISAETKAKMDGLVKAATDYKIIKGNNGKWWKNSDRTLSFTVNAPFSKFESVEIDGKTIAESNYIANSGSTIITLKSSYLQTLSTGEHTITVVFTDNEASGSFKVQKATSIPFTGDTFNVTLWISVMVVAGASLVVLLYKRRKQK